MSDDSALGWLDFIQTHPKLTELAFFFPSPEVVFRLEFYTISSNQI